MASNGTEIEQLLLEALNSLIGILRNNTSLAASSSDDDDNENSLTTTANRLALSATIISIAAFVIALLQAVLQYAGANESARQKCNSAAIGVWSDYVRKRWSLRSWRRKFYYPELRMDETIISMSMRFDGSTSKLIRWMRGLKGEGRSYAWRRCTRGYLGFGFYVSDGIWELVVKSLENDAPWYRANTNHLPWKYRLIWKCFVFLNRPRELHRARATWAQLLDLFSIGYYDDMILGTTDAECIPVAMDVPAQIVSFEFLGKISFTMGLTVVKINAEQRDFDAFGELGSITTESIPGFGRVVRFQKNSPTTVCMAANQPGLWQRTNMDQVVGNFHIPWVQNNNRLGAFDITMSGTLYRPVEEARLAKADTSASESKKNKSNDNSDFWPQRLLWQMEMRHKQIVWPSLLLAVTVSQIPVVVTAFPGDALFRPFIQIFARVAAQAKQREGETYDLMTNFEIGNLKEAFLEVLTNGVFPVTRRSPPGTYRGLSSWAFREMDTYMDDWDRSIPMGCYEVNEIWDDWYAIMSPVINDTRINNGARKATKRPVILPITNDLLESLDLAKWRQDLEDIRKIHYPPMILRFGQAIRRYPRAEHLLWLQVYLLDREIQQVMKYLSTDLQFEGVLVSIRKAGSFSLKIFNAIRSAWSDTQEDSKQEPLVALERMIALELGVTLSEDDISFYIRQLTDLLKLRGVFFAAYMMAIPDSSDLMRYCESGAEISLPMI
ncbi:hypothetical protein G7054_g9568 [Neopestalotiopsis clavispora]|nr:hypothetical protein G7054_g9568 [Neopestalotiopsis clavispora]